MSCNPHPRLATLLLVGLVVLLAACSGGTTAEQSAGDTAGSTSATADDRTTADDSATGTADGGEPAGALSEAEVEFLAGMVPHHAQAVEMALLVPERTAHPDELGSLAEEIIATQEQEIGVMNGLLEAAGEDPIDPEASAADMGHGGGHGAMAGMSGMMSDEDMTALADLEGDAFDLRFLEMMIVHHQGAIDAADQVLDQPQVTPDVEALAIAIIEAQRAEIAQMEAWHADWRA